MTGWQPCKFEKPLHDAQKSKKHPDLVEDNFTGNVLKLILEAKSLNNNCVRNGVVRSWFSFMGTIRNDKKRLFNSSSGWEVNPYGTIYITQWREFSICCTGARHTDGRTMSWLRNKAETIIERKEALGLSASLSLYRIRNVSLQDKAASLRHLPHRGDDNKECNLVSGGEQRNIHD